MGSIITEMNYAQNIEIDISNQPAGICYILLTNGLLKYDSKIIKQ